MFIAIIDVISQLVIKYLKRSNIDNIFDNVAQCWLALLSCSKKIQKWPFKASVCMILLYLGESSLGASVFSNSPYVCMLY